MSAKHTNTSGNTVVSPKSYGEILQHCYDKRQPLFVSGGPGIGKSTVPRQVFKKVAAKENREFLEWSDLTIEQKKACIQTPEKYWIFADMRTSQMDTTSLQGVPNMNKAELLENIPYSWVIYFTSPDAAGCVFFDEINLAAPIVQSITYSAIHDRVISDRRLSDKVYVFAAGNRTQDRAHTFDMPLPLRDRFAELEVQHDAEGWMDWAIKAKINPHLIAFIGWKPSRLYNADEVKAEKAATPRGVERASRLMGELNISSPTEEPMAHTMVAISCGNSFATEFAAYCKIFKALDWDELMKHPSSVKSLQIDQQYAVAAGSSDRFLKLLKEASGSKDAKSKQNIERLLDVIDHLREDFAVLSYRMIKAATPDPRDLHKTLTSLNRTSAFAKKYTKFLIDEAGNS